MKKKSRRKTAAAWTVVREEKSPAPDLLRAAEDVKKDVPWDPPSHKVQPLAASTLLRDVRKDCCRGTHLG
ncbi:hypothetical protein GUJ93_ZPchr0015g6653 [Zizania palustris]|uniref:Uncharacterized protein n=1 Tax=Zizania palustris TaxID=103762 RepID=A0A8J5VVF2_ZIZPA|nr:hypothetical protein GUJ93_ZPchr0015g6653 [Zizania palustris]